MPLRLRVFEERYLVMLAELLKAEEATFGVVLIERGHEVGGGEQRFSVGTTAEVIRLGTQDGFVNLFAQGGQRFEVVRWLDDAPHPRAEVRPCRSWNGTRRTPTSERRPSDWSADAGRGQ
jgi:Lon protease-like protein